MSRKLKEAVRDRVAPVLDEGISFEGKDGRSYRILFEFEDQKKVDSTPAVPPQSLVQAPSRLFKRGDAIEATSTRGEGGWSSLRSLLRSQLGFSDQIHFRQKSQTDAVRQGDGTTQNMIAFASMDVFDDNMQDFSERKPCCLVVVTFIFRVHTTFVYKKNSDPYTYR